MRGTYGKRIPIAKLPSDELFLEYWRKKYNGDMARAEQLDTELRAAMELSTYNRPSGV